VDAGLYAGTVDFYAEVLDQRTGQVVRLIPPEAVLQFFAGISQELGKRLDAKS
jgi:uncharacterized FlaG/YvyC family protein